MYKKGQITIFVIVGLIIVLGLFGYLYFISIQSKNKILEQQPNLDIYSQQISQYVEKCLGDVAVPGVFRMALQ
jgi:hypothetical protein